MSAASPTTYTVVSVSASPGPAPNTPIAMAVPPDGYVPGACNIGPWEIRRRRAFAFAAFGVAAVLFVGLLMSGAPAPFRLLVLFPAWGGTLSWLQARRRFCVAFALAGTSNVADDGAGRRAVTDPAARRADTRATVRLLRDSLALAVVVAITAALLPV